MVATHDMTCKAEASCREFYGTHERFIGFLIESRDCGTGNFPLWLTPDQVRVITLNDDEALINYAKPIVAELAREHGAGGCGF